jgi:peroxiredoxin
MEPVRRTVTALVLAALVAPALAADVAVGSEAPDFTLKDHSGEALTLSTYRGRRPVLIAFYPKSFTGG